MSKATNHDKVLNWSTFKAFADYKFKLKLIQILSSDEKGFYRKHIGQGQKAYL